MTADKLTPEATDANIEAPFDLLKECILAAKVHPESFDLPQLFDGILARLAAAEKECEWRAKVPQETPGDVIANVHCPSCSAELTIQHGDDEGEIGALCRTPRAGGRTPLTRDQLFDEPEFDEYVSDFQRMIEDVLHRRVSDAIGSADVDLDASGTDGDETAYSCGQIELAISAIENHYDENVVAPLRAQLDQAVGLLRRVTQVVGGNNPDMIAYGFDCIKDGRAFLATLTTPTAQKGAEDE